jgi:hypothetical protein
VLLQARYAPLVVDRRNREDYIRKLDAANDGDLRPLIRLFAQLETVALRSELERPAVVTPASGTAVDIARAYSERLRTLRGSAPTENVKRAEVLATELERRIEWHLRSAADGLKDAFRTVDPDARATATSSGPLHPERRWWFVELTLRTLGYHLFYRVFIRSAGGDTGVLAVHVTADSIADKKSGQEASERFRKMLEPTPTDTVTLVATDEIDARWPEVEELIDRTLAAAVDHFGRRLG